jgi:hypothetical protein
MGTGSGQGIPSVPLVPCPVPTRCVFRATPPATLMPGNDRTIEEADSADLAATSRPSPHGRNSRGEDWRPPSWVRLPHSFKHTSSWAPCPVTPTSMKGLDGYGGVARPGVGKVRVSPGPPTRRGMCSCCPHGPVRLSTSRETSRWSGGVVTYGEIVARRAEIGDQPHAARTPAVMWAVNWRKR